MTQWLANLVVSRRWSVLGLLAIVTGVAIFLAVQIDFDFTPQAIFAGQDDIVVFAEKFKETFGHEDAVLLLALEAQGQRDVLDRELLSWEGEVARRLLELPDVVEVQAIPTLKIARWHALGARRFTTQPLVAQFPVDAATETRVRATVGRLRMIEGSMVSKDRRAGAVIVFLNPQARPIHRMRRVVADVTQALEQFPPPGDYRVRLSGLPALRVNIVKDLQADQIHTLPLAAVMFVVVLAIIFRRPGGVVLPLLAAAVGLAWTLGLLVLLGQTFNIISSILPVLLLILGVSNSVHVLGRFAEEVERAEGNRLLATRRAIAHMIVPCILTFGTTAVGFTSTMAAHSEVLRAFGWQAAAGMFCLYFSVLLTLAVFFPSFRPPRHSRADGGASRLARLAAGMGRWVALHPWQSLAITAAVMAASAGASRHLAINSHMVEMYDDDHSTIATMRFVEDKLVGFLPLEVSLTADHSGRFLEPEIYHKVAEAERFAAGLPAVLFTGSYVDLHQEVYAQSRGQDALRDKLPSVDREGQQRIRRIEEICEKVAGTLNYHAFITRDGRQARILLRMRDVGTRETLRLIDSLEAKLAELFPAGGGVEFRLTGDAYLNAKAMDGFVRDLFSSLFGASLVIFGLIAVLFRSLRIGLIAIPPNFIPLGVTLGYIGLRGYDLNASNVIVFSISLGIAVDDTIHFLSRFREEHQLGGSMVDVIVRCYLGTGRSILITSLLLISGLSILLISDFVPTRRFGELTAVTMTAALFGDLLLLPSCIVLFWRDRVSQTPKTAVAQPFDQAARPCTVV